MGCNCAKRSKAARQMAERDLARAERLASEGRITQATLLRSRARALKLGVAVAGAAGKALGIDGEVGDGSGTDRGPEPDSGGTGSAG